MVDWPGSPDYKNFFLLLAPPRNFHNLKNDSCSSGSKVEKACREPKKPSIISESYNNYNILIYVNIKKNFDPLLLWVQAMF